MRNKFIALLSIVVFFCVSNVKAQIEQVTFETSASLEKLEKAYVELTEDANLKKMVSSGKYPGIKEACREIRKFGYTTQPDFQEVAPKSGCYRDLVKLKPTNEKNKRFSFGGKKFGVLNPSPISGPFDHYMVRHIPTNRLFMVKCVNRVKKIITAYVRGCSDYQGTVTSNNTSTYGGNTSVTKTTHQDAKKTTVKTNKNTFANTSVGKTDDTKAVFAPSLLGGNDSISYSDPCNGCSNRRVSGINPDFSDIYQKAEHQKTIFLKSPTVRKKRCCQKNSETTFFESSRGSDMDLRNEYTGVYDGKVDGNFVRTKKSWLRRNIWPILGGLALGYLGYEAYNYFNQDEGVNSAKPNYENGKDTKGFTVPSRGLVFTLN